MDYNNLVGSAGTRKKFAAWGSLNYSLPSCHCRVELYGKILGFWPRFTFLLRHIFGSVTVSETHNLPGSQFSISIGNISEQNKDACPRRLFILMGKTRNKYLCHELEDGKRYTQDNVGQVQDGGRVAVLNPVVRVGMAGKVRFEQNFKR